MSYLRKLPCEVWRGALELSDVRTRNSTSASSKLLAALSSEFTNVGTQAQALGLRETYDVAFGLQWSEGVSMDALVDANFTPKPFLRKFCNLKKLSVDLTPPTEEEANMYYLVVPSAIGLLLETGAYPQLQMLIIKLGYEFGTCADGSGPSEIFKGDSTMKLFSYHAWVHQLAISIVRAIDSGNTPRLTQVSMVSSSHGGMPYYCNCGFHNPDLSYMLEGRADTQTRKLREKLDRCMVKLGGNVAIM